MDNSILFLTLLFIGSYLIGSLNTAKILTNVFRKGPDISTIGSKNAGARNTLLTLGKRAGLIVFTGDMGKGALIVLAAQWLGFSQTVALACAVFGIVGHNWPIFFKFRGGKGIAIMGGALFMLHPLSALAATGLTILFVLLRVSGLVPFGAISLYIFLEYWDPEYLAPKLVLLAALAIIYLRRLQAERQPFKQAPSKIKALKNLLVFDRTTNDPPPLNTIFRNFGIKKKNS